jgi:hypothetical protein
MELARSLAVSHYAAVPSRWTHSSDVPSRMFVTPGKGFLEAHLLHHFRSTNTQNRPADREQLDKQERLLGFTFRGKQSLMIVG